MEEAGLHGCDLLCLQKGSNVHSVMQYSGTNEHNTNPDLMTYIARIYFTRQDFE